MTGGQPLYACELCGTTQLDHGYCPRCDQDVCLGCGTAFEDGSIHVLSITSAGEVPNRIVMVSVEACQKES